jgi:iron complex transport system substrate-binding protein
VALRFHNSVGWRNYTVALFNCRFLKRNWHKLDQFLRSNIIRKRPSASLVKGLLLAFSSLLLTLGLAGCDVNNSGQAVINFQNNDQCVANFDAQTDYFPQKASIKYAKGFTVSYHKNYKLVTIDRPFASAKTPLRYVLLQCGTPFPKDVKPDQIITVPVRSLMVFSTTHIPHLEKLKVVDRLVGIADWSLVYSPILREKASQRNLTEVAKGGRLNIEEIIRLNPDLITTFAVGNAEADTYPKLVELGLKVVLNAEYLENSPLGRAEWLKFTALFFNQEALAEEEFNQIAARYEKIARLTQKVTRKPTVLTGLNYQGTWYVAGGKSYSAQFLRDAGANYLWADDQTTGSIPLSFEAVFAKGNNADFWLPNAAMWRSLADITASDRRYAEFAAFRRGQVFNNNRRQVDGANDFWESGVLNPDVVLADLVKIFHPTLLPDHNLFYFQKLQ